MSELSEKDLRKKSAEALHGLAIDEVLEGQRAGEHLTLRDGAPQQARHYSKAAALAGLACYKAIAEGQDS
jgi:hypothetical protein